MSAKPSVLFLCVHNAGKSQTAAALMRHLAGDTVTVYSAGTDPDSAVSASAVAALAEIGVSTGDEQPKPIDPAVLASVDRIVILGRDAQLAADAVAPERVERWVIAAESDPAVSGADRARLVRDEIAARVRELLEEFVAPSN